MFPNNSMGPPAPPPPSAEERWAIKRRAAGSIRALIPAYGAHKYFATDDEQAIINDVVENILEPLDDVYLNKHLVYAIVELILVRLIPELEEQPISDLLAERGVEWEDVSMSGDGDSSDKGGKEG